MTGVLPLGSRLIRGAKRIGLFLAIPLALIGVGASLVWGSNNASDAASRHSQIKCLASKSQSGLIQNRLDAYSSEKGYVSFVFAENDCPGPGYSATSKEVIAATNAEAPSYVGTFFPIAAWGSAASLAIGLLLYGFCWGLGWVAAGFTADRNP